MHSDRYLIINADDFGIGPDTSRGILELANAGHLSSTVMLVNSPYAPAAVHQWWEQGRPIEIGWHPVLTLDKPVLPAEAVPSLVDAEGQFLPLKVFLRRLYSGKVNANHIRAELSAQFRRCCEMLGKRPTIVNAHHHVHIFPPVGAILRDILSQQGTTYFRMVREPWGRLITHRGARLKRLVLNYFGRREAAHQRRNGFLANDSLIGVMSNTQAISHNVFADVVSRATGNVVELACHPGFRDETLVGRDCRAGDGALERRVHEMAMLSDPQFRQAWMQAGFQLITPEQLGRIYKERDRRNWPSVTNGREDARTQQDLSV